MLKAPPNSRDQVPGAPVPRPTSTTDKGGPKSGLRGTDFTAGENALKPPGGDAPVKGPTTKTDAKGGPPPSLVEQLARFRALVVNDGPPKEVKLPANIKPRTPPPGFGDMTAMEYGELCARIEAGYRSDPLFAVFESMGFDPETTMKSIESLRTRDRTASYDSPEIDTLGAKGKGAITDSLGKVELDPKKYVDVLTRARSFLHFGAAAQLTHGMGNGGIGQDDELVKAAMAVVDGYIVYLQGLLTTKDQDERFQFEMDTQLTGSPNLEVLEALRVLQVRSPQLAGPRGSQLYAAWSAARASIKA
jgi:hypothetical protein